jgi:hypothetical protein
MRTTRTILALATATLLTAGLAGPLTAEASGRHGYGGHHGNPEKHRYGQRQHGHHWRHDRHHHRHHYRQHHGHGNYGYRGHYGHAFWYGGPGYSFRYVIRGH